MKKIANTIFNFLKRNLINIFILAIILLSMFSISNTYIESFDPFNAERNEWEGFATYLNGIATPILASISVWLLFMTWRDNKNELEQMRAQARLSNRKAIAEYYRPIINECLADSEDAFDKRTHRITLRYCKDNSYSALAQYSSTELWLIYFNNYLDGYSASNLPKCDFKENFTCEESEVIKSLNVTYDEITYLSKLLSKICQFGFFADDTNKKILNLSSINFIVCIGCMGIVRYRKDGKNDLLNSFALWLKTIDENNQDILNLKKLILPEYEKSKRIN